MKKPNDHGIGLLVVAAILAFLTGLAFSFLSCTKEVPTFNGTYYGEITYYIPGFDQTTQARRIISDHEDGTTKFHWWDAGDINAYSVIEEGTYIFYNIKVPYTPYCYGVLSHNYLLFNGKGTFIGQDSLVESGIVYRYSDSDTTSTQCVSGTWIAKFKRF